MTNLFCRAIEYNSNQWVYGVPFKKTFMNFEIEKLYVIGSNCYVSDNNPLEDSIVRVKPETVTWSTGILDKELIMIYEGDIVETNNKNKFVVIFRSGRFCLMSENDWNSSKSDTNWQFYPTYDIYQDNSIVVGNIFEKH